MTTGGGVPVIRYDLARYATVQSVISVTNFVTDAIGFGNGAFVGYYVYIMRKGTGTGLAPQGEAQQVTAYNNLTGQITISAGYTQPIAVGDELLIIHPSLAATSPGGQIALLHGVAPVTGFTTGNWNGGGVGGTTICTIGAAGVRYKVHSLMIDISALGGNVTPILYININGALKKIFPPKAGTSFNVAAGDAPGIAIINGTFGIANALQVRAYSDAGGDDGTNINYEYFVEAM